MNIRDIRAREVLATNAERTIEVEIVTDKGKVRASSPMGTSTGRHEAVSLPADFVMKKFLLFRRSLRSQSYANQKEADDKIRQLDASNNFREIGGNLATALSSAFLKAFALQDDQEIFEYLGKTYKLGIKIPKPVSIVAGGWQGVSDIQEFHVVPVHQSSFADSVHRIAKIYSKVGAALKSEDPHFKFSRNLESGWITTLRFEKILKIIQKIAENDLMKIGMDFAASHMWNGTSYVYSHEKFSTEKQMELVENLCKEFSVLYVEDPLREEDFPNFSLLTRKLSPRIVCGDDLYATKVNRLIYGMERKATNAAIVKPNQVGTITDVVEFVKEAKKSEIATVMSHRSAETDDAFIAHLAAGLGCDYAKMGIAGERIIKINELIRIEERMRGIE